MAESKDMGNFSDGYHTFNELYRYRMLYNAAFLNEYSSGRAGKWYLKRVGKSRLHHDGKPPFGGGWFIVWFTDPDGHVISNHYENKYWDYFAIPEYETAPEWDGSTPNQEADYLEQWLKCNY